MIGQTVSHYRILEKLGEGGMGIVYKAQDTRLNRFVALKFLPEHLSASEQDKARFLQEAQAAASLNHPNICTIYGIEEYETPAAAGVPSVKQIFIAMELIDGETLREKKQTFSMKQAIDVGVQIAEGLAAAHEKGIVHRDIKPENIMVRKDGIVQIMDFGLAKLRGASRLTKQGSMVGTVGYMSPEQVQGQDADHRTDIFSLGVILYELLSGQSPFKGVHETAVIYEIVNVDAAPISSLKPDVDADIDAIVLECLAKEPDERYQSAKEVAKELRRFKRESSRQRMSRISSSRIVPTSAIREAAGSPMDAPLPSFLDRSRSMLWSWKGLTLLFFITTLLSAAMFFSRSSSGHTEVIRAFIPPPEKQGFSDAMGGGHIAIAPDGRQIAFAAVDSGGGLALWVRPLNSLTATRLPGTEGAAFPFWSPDNRFIGYFAKGKLKKIEATGGPSFTLCDVVTPRGATWGTDGVIVLPLDQMVGLSRVSDGGGTPRTITTLDSVRGEQTHRWPSFLPDGKHFLFLARTAAAGSGGALDAICVGSVDGKMNKRILAGISNAEFASGHLLYMRENSLMAHPFDPDKLELKGDPFPICESVEFNARYSRAWFSVSHAGILLYEGTSPTSGSDLIIVDPTGKRPTFVGQPEVFVSARFSHDNRKIAMDLFDIRVRNADVWLYEIDRRVNSRFTFDPGLEVYPVWSPDGTRLVFSSNRKGHQDLYEKPSTGASNEQPILESDHDKIATDWSSDGRFILFHSPNERSRWNVWVLPMTGDRKPRPFIQSDYAEANARFSPDMKWIAYQSDESGSNQVYVLPFPGPGAKRQVSTSGGTFPRWNRSGRVIYFIEGGKVMSAEVNGSGSTFEIGNVRIWFDPAPMGGTNIRDISDDGQKILLEVPRSRQTLTPMSLVVNWDKELRGRKDEGKQE